MVDPCFCQKRYPHATDGAQALGVTFLENNQHDEGNADKDIDHSDDNSECVHGLPPDVGLHCFTSEKFHSQGTQYRIFYHTTARQARDTAAFTCESGRDEFGRFCHNERDQ
jgi:hypothetical protein